MHTLCLILILCGPRSWRATSAVTYAMAELDAYATIRNCPHGACFEVDPFARPFVYSRRNKIVLPIGVGGEAAAVNLTSYWLKKRGKKWWMLPQAASLSYHTWGFSYSWGNR